MEFKFILLLFIGFEIISCNSNRDKNAEAKDGIVLDTSTATDDSMDSTKTIINKNYIWTVKNEGGNEKLVRPEDGRLDTFSSAQLIQMINEGFPDIHLDLIKVSHDTIYVQIPENATLSQGMGDTGAEIYLASATYTLTELNNIKFVNIAMKTGDHVEPGVYSRNDFKRWK